MGKGVFSVVGTGCPFHLSLLFLLFLFFSFFQLSVFSVLRCDYFWKAKRKGTLEFKDHVRSSCSSEPN